MAGWSSSDRDWPPPSRPLPADGIRARSQRGPIGNTWWSQRFIAVLESFRMGGRLDRGRRYARRGQVLGLEVNPGRVSASVQGSRARPYQVLIAVPTLSQADWNRVEEALAGRASFLAKLLAGEMPPNVEEAFSACSLSLFPTSPTDLDTACSCPDWANPCKHVAATYYLLAEAFDADPFLILCWRGRTRADLLERLSARRRASGPGSDAGADPWVNGAAGAGEDWPQIDDELDLDATLERFFQAGSELATVRPWPRAAAVPDAVLRQLDPPALEVGGRTLSDVIAGLYPAITARAAELAAGPPASGPEASGTEASYP
ncbi:MAG: SWIM zinc finger family protein [Acidimicrobiales bacterium]|nr:SWIM zinc finger family protein [Acidimicrobiales bacterium]